jgi:hypothetical protein
VELQLEAGIHASDHVILEGHAGFLSSNRVLPGEVRDHVLDIGLDDSFSNGPGFVLLFDRHLDLNPNPFDYLIRIDFWRALIECPEVIIDADFGCGAFARCFNRAHGRQCPLQRIGSEQRSEAAHFAQQRRRVGKMCF